MDKKWLARLLITLVTAVPGVRAEGLFLMTKSCETFVVCLNLLPL